MGAVKNAAAIPGFTRPPLPRQIIYSSKERAGSRAPDRVLEYRASPGRDQLSRFTRFQRGAAPPPAVIGSERDRMETTDLLLRLMAVAMIGWVATSYRVKHSRLAPRWRRVLILPLWFIWMSFALGGPVYTGRLPLNEALATGASFTVGMTVYLFLFSLSMSRRSR